MDKLGRHLRQSKAGPLQQASMTKSTEGAFFYVPKERHRQDEQGGVVDCHSD